MRDYITVHKYICVPKPEEYVKLSEKLCTGNCMKPLPKCTDMICHDSIQHDSHSYHATLACLCLWEEVRRNENLPQRWQIRL